jgi:hypothetical protein
VSGPFTFVTTHTINDGRLADYMRQHSEFITLLETNEPRLLDFRAHMNEEQTEVTFLFAFPDAEAADVHMQVAREHIGRRLEITKTARLEIYGGTPGPILQQVLIANADMGVPVSVKPTHIGGFSRMPAR